MIHPGGSLSVYVAEQGSHEALLRQGGFYAGLYYNVFHIDQCEGVTAKHTHEVRFPDGAETLEAAQEVIYDYLSREGVKLSHEEGDRAFYRPATDEVVLPIRKQFVSTAEYYSTVFHELTHSTGHPSRLNRLNRPSFFGTDTV